MAGELETVLAEWVDRRSVDMPDRDDQGRHSMVVDGLYELTLSQLGDSIFLESDIVDMPERREDAEELLSRLMHLHLTHARAGEEVLSVTENGRTLTMFRVLRAAGIGVSAFERSLGDFVNALALTHARIEGPASRRPQVALPTMQVFHA